MAKRASSKNGAAGLTMVVVSVDMELLHSLRGLHRAIAGRVLLVDSP